MAQLLLHSHSSSFVFCCWLLLLALVPSPHTIGALAEQKSRHASPPPPPPPRVAIIGGGIAGASAAYFLRDLLQQPPSPAAAASTVDVYTDEDTIGGRLAVAEFDGRQFESGGSIIHEKNLYMRHFARQVLDLSVMYQSEEMRLAVYDGKEAVLDTSDWYVKMMQLLHRYGVSAFVRLRRFVASTLTDFARIYARQNAGQAFTTVRSLLAGMSDRFPALAGQSIEQLLLDLGFDPVFINELVAGAMRCNYGQNVTIHGFVGAVSLAGAEGGLWSVRGGNRLVADGLLEQLAGAGFCRLLRKSRVARIAKTAKGTWRVAYSVGVGAGEVESEAEYDQVILTAPAHQLFNIQLDGATVMPVPYQTTVATFVKGALNHAGLGLASKQERYTLFTGTPAAPLAFNSVGFQFDTSGRASDSVYKVFSERELTQQQLGGLFSRVDASRSVSWLAYPLYNSGGGGGGGINASFILAKGLYHTSPVELAASAMEMAAVAGRNAALLAYHDWLGGGGGGGGGKIDPSGAVPVPPEEFVALRRTEL